VSDFSQNELIIYMQFIHPNIYIHLDRSDVHLVGTFMGTTFNKPRAMTIAEIGDLAARYAYTSKVLYDAGADGIQLHAAHGYLLFAAHAHSYYLILKILTQIPLTDLNSYHPKLIYELINMVDHPRTDLELFSKSSLLFELQFLIPNSCYPSK
jgi:hypothetical protein